MKVGKSRNGKPIFKLPKVKKPTRNIKSATHEGLEVTTCASPRDMVEWMHFYYCVGDFDAANSIREWMGSVGYVVNIDKDKKQILLKGKDGGYIRWNYDMSNIDLQVITMYKFAFLVIPFAAMSGNLKINIS